MREQIENEWLPFALSIGVEYDSFWRLTPRSLRIIAEGYNRAYIRQTEHENAIAHLQGRYIAEAVSAAVWGKHKYPEQPYDLELNKTKEDEERENEKQLELFKANLDTFMINFKKAKEQG